MNAPEILAPHETPNVLRDGPHVQRIEHPEPAIVLSPEEAARRNDEKERETYLSGHMDYAEIPAARVGQLCGDHVTSFGRGPICRRLIEDARDGRLRVNGDLDRMSDGRKRPHPSQTMVDREALAEWLAKYGDDELRESAGAIWCRYAARVAHGNGESPAKEP